MKGKLGIGKIIAEHLDRLESAIDGFAELRRNEAVLRRVAEACKASATQASKDFMRRLYGRGIK